MATVATGRNQAARTVERQEESQSVLEAAIANTQKRSTVTAKAAAVLGVDPSQLIELLRNVWKTSKGQPPLTPQEMFQGISMIARFELDPIAREVYVTRTSSGLATIIGIDGWMKILDRTDHYDGFEMSLHEDANREVDYVDCTIYSKKRSKPTTYRAYAKEYAAIGGFMRQKLPLHMLRIFALRHAARLFTPLGGTIMTEEEARYMQSFAPQHDEAPPALIGKLFAEDANAPAEHCEPQENEQPERISGLEGVKEMLLACTDSGDVSKVVRGIRKERTLTKEEDQMLQEMEDLNKERCRKGDAHEG